MKDHLLLFCVPLETGRVPGTCEYLMHDLEDFQTSKEYDCLLARLLILFSPNQKCQSLYQEREPLVRRIVDTKGQNAGWLHEVMQTSLSKRLVGDFPGGAVVKNPPANAGDTG